MIPRWLARSYPKLKSPQYGFSGRMGILQNFTDLSGHGSSGYWTEPIIKYVPMEIVNALRLGERSRASSLLSDISHGNHLFTTKDFLCILEYCAQSPDPLVALDTWRIMREKDVYVDNKCYLFILRALCKGGHLEEAFNLMNMLGGNHDFHPTLPMCNNFLGGCARISSVTHANECLDLMERHMVGKNERTYVELLKLAVLQQNISAAHEIWKEYMKYYSPSIITLRKFIWSFTRLRDLEVAYESLQHMVALVFRGGFRISETAEGKLFISRLDIPIPSSCEVGEKRYSKEVKDFEYSGLVDWKKLETYANGDGHDCTAFSRGRSEAENAGFSMTRKANESLPGMDYGCLIIKKHHYRIRSPVGDSRYNSLSVTKILRWSFNDVIHACAKTLNCRLAEQLHLQMQNLGLEPSCSTYDGLIRAVVSERGFHNGLEVLKTMRQKNLKPHDSTLATIAVSCSKELELDLAEVLLDQICKSPFPYPYNAFLEACGILDQPERAVRILAKMKEMKLQPDIRTYELLFLLFGNVNPPYEEGNMLSQGDVAKRINAIEMDMIKHGIQHNYSSMKNLLKAVGAEGMVRELVLYLRMAENQFARGYSCLGTPTYNVVLQSLVEAKESHMAIQIFRSMKASGFLPDAATYNIMIDCCSIIRCFKSACTLVSLMVRNGFYPRAVTYTALIKILLGNGDFDEALNLLDQGSLEGIQPDVLLFNTVLQGACKKRKIDVIELIVERMHQNKVQPDASTCFFVFSAYIDQDFVSTAMEALQVLSMRMISEDDSILEEKRTEFEENIVFAEDAEAESRIIQLFKDFKDDLAVALLHLRWCATLGFHISWLPSKSPWAIRISNNYGTRGVLR